MIFYTITSLTNINIFCTAEQLGEWLVDASIDIKITNFLLTTIQKIIFNDIIRM